jgi:pyrroline-5-carboxylate reductase
MSQNILFVGAGSMAEAIVKGLVSSGIVAASDITMCNRGNEERLLQLRETYAVQTAVYGDDDFHTKLKSANVIVLAMKPKDAGEALKALSPHLRKEQLLVSVIAGLSIATISDIIGADIPVVRTMPNTSSTIGLGATGIAFSQIVNESQRDLSLHMFQSTGITVVVDEPLLDVVTGVSGSGPAYLYYMMEAMIRAGEQLGLSPEVARQLTVQTVIGAGEMVKQTGELPEALRHKVTSPNGTTQAALETMAAHHFQPTVEAAVKRASERAGELGQMISEMINK